MNAENSVQVVFGTESERIKDDIKAIIENGYVKTQENQEQNSEEKKVISKSSTLYAPIDGVVSVLFPTKHAVAITTNEGIELLVHIGIDTVKLNGEGFIARVKQGDLLLTLDTEIIKSKAKSLISPEVVTNMNETTSMNIDYSQKKHGDKVAEVIQK